MEESEEGVGAAEVVWGVVKSRDIMQRALFSPVEVLGKLDPWQQKAECAGRLLAWQLSLPLLIHVCTLILNPFSFYPGKYY